VLREYSLPPEKNLSLNELIGRAQKEQVKGQASYVPQRAGMREGDRVVSMSIYWDDVSKPVKLTVRRGGDTTTLTYSPRGHTVGVTPQYVLDEARYHSDPHGCQASSNLD
jgi:hypothetical protein